MGPPVQRISPWVRSPGALWKTGKSPSCYKYTSPCHIRPEDCAPHTAEYAAVGGYTLPPEEHGPTGTKDLSMGEVRESRWGHRKLSSAALDYLFNRGDLCVADKRGTQKYFDLTRIRKIKNLFQHGPVPHKIVKGSQETGIVPLFLICWFILCCPCGS